MAETNLIKKNDLAREREMEFVDQFGYSIKKLVEALGGVVLGESLGQIGIFAVFILVLMFRPTGLFGSRAT